MTEEKGKLTFWPSLESIQKALVLVPEHIFICAEEFKCLEPALMPELMLDEKSIFQVENDGSEACRSALETIERLVVYALQGPSLLMREYLNRASFLLELDPEEHAKQVSGNVKEAYDAGKRGAYGKRWVLVLAE